MAKEPGKRHDVFRTVAIALLVLGGCAALVCAAAVSSYLELERENHGDFLTMFSLDAAHDRAVAYGVVAVLMLAAGGVLGAVSRRGKPPA